METAKGLYSMTHNNNNDNNNIGLERLDNQLECMIRRLKLFWSLLLNDNGDTENNKLALQIKNIILGLLESTMKSQDLRIRCRSMQAWSLILDTPNLLPLIGYDCNKKKLEQNIEFENIVIGIMKYVLNHFRFKFHDLSSVCL